MRKLCSRYRWYLIMNIKKETIETIENSSQYLVSFDKYGTHTNAKTKISITYYTLSHAYTVEAWAIITRQKFMQLSGYDTLVSILNPSNYTATRIDKQTGEDVTNDNHAACAAVFSILCNTLAQVTDRVHLEQYQTIKNVN